MIQHLASRSRRALSAGIAVALLTTLSACNDYRTTGSPVGDLTLTAEFEDVQHLVVGHTVRMSDVPIGTVTGVDLDGYTAVVEISIADGRDIPEGTVASISATSLLGENYVRLVPPETPVSTIHRDGEELATSGTDASFETVTERLLVLLRAVNGRDIATIIDESHTALVGRGDELNELIGTVDELSEGLVEQTDELVTILDLAAALGDELAPDATRLGNAIDATAAASGAITAQRDRIVDAVTQILELARTLDTEVLDPHRDRLEVILDRLVPVLDLVAEERQQVIAVLDALNRANVKLPAAIEDGTIFGHIIITGLRLLNDQQILFEDIGLAGLIDLLPLAGSDAVIATLDVTDSVESILFPDLGGTS